MMKPMLDHRSKASTVGWVILILVLSVSSTSKGQSGFSADAHPLGLSLDGLFAVKGSTLSQGQLAVSIQGDWAHHLLGVRPLADDPIRWVVEDRFTTRVAVGFTPTSYLRLETGFCSAAFQQGETTNTLGAFVGLRSGMGMSWFSTVWDPLWWFDSPSHAAVAATIVLPTPQPEALTGGEKLGLELEARFAYNFGLVRTLINLGLAAKQKIRFRNLMVGDGLAVRAGVELGKEIWPVSGSLELAVETPLSAPFSLGVNDAWETLAGIHVPLFGDLGLHLGAGIGLAGAFAPTWRGMLLLQWVARKSDESR